MTLDVVVVGTSEPGPRYAGGSDAFGSASSPAPGSAPSSAGAADVARAGNESRTSGGLVLWVGVPLLVTLLGATLVVALLLWRSRTPAAPPVAPYGHPAPSAPPGSPGSAPEPRPDVPPDR
ncbi:hypothetical protein ABGB07_13525 [Micromonosporaceae bacterium B7E4]